MALLATAENPAGGGLSADNTRMYLAKLADAGMEVLGAAVELLHCCQLLHFARQVLERAATCCTTADSLTRGRYCCSEPLKHVAGLGGAGLLLLHNLHDLVAGSLHEELPSVRTELACRCVDAGAGGVHGASSVQNGAVQHVHDRD
jgi:hypothetical protein